MKRIAVVAALVVVVSACGSGDDEAGDGGEVASSPIAEFLGAPDFSDQESAETQVIEQQRQAEQAIADCMAEQGFEYIPQDPENFVFFGDEDEELERGSDEWVEKYGFGISTMWFSQEEIGPDLVGIDDDRFSGPDAPEDPNTEIREAMSESERQAYDEALYGDMSGFAFDETMSEEELAEEETAFEPGGCQGEGFNQGANQFYNEFQDEMQEMEERIQNDSRIVEAQQEVSSCVAERGLEYTDQQTVFDDYFAELQEIDSMVGFPGENLTQEDFESMSESELNELFSQPREFPAEALEMLADLQSREIELAVAVNECGGGFDNQQELQSEVRVEYEQEFLEENQDRIAEYEDSASGS